MANNQQTFDMGTYLKDQGAQFIGTDDAGNYLVRGADGVEGKLDTGSLMKDLD
jgi:homoserine acetyltransferase